MTHLSRDGLHPVDLMPRGFTLAMRARMSLAEAATPAQRVAQPAGWLLVSRWGEAGEYLSIGHAGAAPDAGPPPRALVARATWLGRHQPAPGDDPLTERFALQRDQPPGMALAGSFLPGDGLAWFGRRAGTHRLTLRGRVAPAPGSPWRGSIWHIEAEQVEWLGETFAAS